MAYLDTGELPWDMDLFDGQAEKVRMQPVGTRNNPGILGQPFYF